MRASDIIGKKVKGVYGSVILDGRGRPLLSAGGGFTVWTDPGAADAVARAYNESGRWTQSGVLRSANVTVMISEVDHG
jgi:hypothetical protein